jgi:hypothetical protein
MTRDDIIRMAREAGWHDGLLAVTFTVPLLERFAALVAAAEREACAKENAELLQALQNLHQRCHWADAPEEMDAAKAAIEKAIRARGEV